MVQKRTFVSCKFWGSVCKSKYLLWSMDVGIYQTGQTDQTGQTYVWPQFSKPIKFTYLLTILKTLLVTIGFAWQKSIPAYLNGYKVV